MTPEQLNQIITRLHKQLIETLVKFDPGLKKYETENKASFYGLKYLIEQSLPVLYKTGESEQKQILELAKLARHYFKLHDNGNVFATCFIFLNSATVNGLTYEFETDEIADYFLNRYHQTFRAGSISYSNGFLSALMLGQWIPGFSVNTYIKFSAVRKFNGKIEIERHVFQDDDEMILYDEMEAEMTNELHNNVSFDQRTFVRQFNKEWNSQEVDTWINNKKKEFYQYALMIREKYDTLIDSFNTLFEILTIELDQRKKSAAYSYLHLKFDEDTNQKIIDYLYEKLQSNFFETPLENFKTVFSPEFTHPIFWKKSFNSFLKLFFGFSNLKIDKINTESFDGLIKKKADVTIAIDVCFKFKDEPSGSFRDYISSKLNNSNLYSTKPYEINELWPTILQIKKWSKHSELS